MNADAASGERPVEFSRESVRSMFTLLTVFWWTGFAFLPVHGLGAPMAVAGIVLFYIQLYRHWLLLQGHGARTTPGKAVGFAFIPIYCFYWWFIALPGLAADNNRHMDDAAIRGPRLSRGLGIAICVLDILACTVGLFPPAGVALTIAGVVVGYLFALQQKRCILAVMEHRERAAQASAPAAG